MPDSYSMLIFITAASLLLITPGPAVIYIVARSIEQGRTAGLISTLGIAAGTLFHVAAAAFGLSALLMSSALAFSIVKYAGAAYLIYLGLKNMFSKNEIRNGTEIEKKKLSKLFYQGVLVNLLNPKTALFFFAFLPQFVNRSSGKVTVQILFLGLLFVAIGIISDGLWALSAGSAGKWLKNKINFLRYQKYFSGSIYLALGIAAAFSGSNKK